MADKSKVQLVELLDVYEVYVLTGSGPYAWKHRSVLGSFFSPFDAELLASREKAKVGKQRVVDVNGSLCPVSVRYPVKGVLGLRPAAPTVALPEATSASTDAHVKDDVRTNPEGVTTSVSPTWHDPRVDTPPAGTLLKLLTIGGREVEGHWRDDGGFIAWAPKLRLPEWAKQRLREAYRSQKYADKK